MSLALYRKHRPGSFAEVIGQEHVTGPLTQALRSGRVHHAYLFSGPRGCGKTSSARILARSLNCADGPTAEPCGVCDSCVALAPNGPGSLDVVEIDAASHGGVDDARDLRERAFYAPVSSRYKIYIVDEAHMVTSAGFNALLKLVEEPPEFLKFVFATTEPDKVIPTIRSRTFHYPFRLVPQAVLREHLARICEAEGVRVDPLVLPLVVRAGAGSVRDALSVLDQLLAGAGPEGLGYAEAVALLGFTDAALLDEVVDAVAAGDGSALFGAVDQVVSGGHDPRRFAADLLERFRDLLVLSAVPDATTRGLLDVPEDAAERMQAQATRLGPAQLSRAADLLAAALTEMRGATAPRLQLELVCARILLPAAATGEASVLARLDRLERRLDISGTPAALHGRPEPGAAERSAPEQSAPEAAGQQPEAAPAAGPPAGPPPEPAGADLAGEAPAPRPAAATPEQPTPSASPPAGSMDAAAVRRVWPQVLEAVKSIKRTPHALLADAQVTGLEGQTLVLTFGTAAIGRRFADPVNSDVLLEALHRVLGVDWKVVVSEGQAAPVPSMAAPASRPGAGPAASAGPADAPAGSADVVDDPAGDPTVSGYADGAAADDPPAEDDGVTGLALLEQHLGAQVIDEIDED